MLYVVTRMRDGKFAEYAVTARTKDAAIRKIRKVYEQADHYLPGAAYTAVHFPNGRVILKSTY